MSGRDDETVYSSGPRGARGGRKSWKDPGPPEPPRASRGDGIVRLRRETKGRGGKTVTTVSGVPLSSDRLRELAGELKRACGTGGSTKQGVIEIQGDHRETLQRELEARGYTVKLAGG